MIRRISLPVPDGRALDEMACAKRPLGMYPGRVTHELLRETWFDTSDEALRDQRLTLRLRLDASGRQTLCLTRVTGLSLEGVVEEDVLETPVVGGGLYATLSGTGELATLVRGVVEPAGLRPRVALDIDREVRDLRPGLMGKPTLRVTCDRIVAHTAGASSGLHFFDLSELRPGTPSLEALVERARHEHGLVHDGMDTLERVRSALGSAAEARGGMAPREVRVTLIVVRGGEVALVPTADGLGLPSTRGSGEDIAREYLADVVGRAEAECDLDLVGFSPTWHGGVDLELWLHQCAPAKEGAGAPGQAASWIPLEELLERVGVQGLRGGDLVAALHLLVLSEIGHRLLREAGSGRRAPLDLPLPARPSGVGPGEEPGDFLDTELSILDFNQRVLELAEDESIPLLERFRFLGIFSSNLDEFFTVRVGRQKTAAAHGSQARKEELTPVELLDVFAVRIRALLARQHRCLSDALLPALAGRGVHVRTWGDLQPDQKDELTRTFSQEIFPALTPTALSASPGHPFPRLASLGLSLMAVLQVDGEGDPQLAHVPIPMSMPRFLPIAGSTDMVPVEEVVKGNVAALFPSASISDAHLFRVTRVGDVEIDEDASESLLAAVEDEVEARPFKPVIRLEVQNTMPREVRAQLIRELHSERSAGDTVRIGRADLYEVGGPLDLRGYGELADLDLPTDRYQPFTARQPLVHVASVFDAVRENDVLVHHPYDDFEDTVGRFLREAAEDPQVVSIKLTLYRTGRNSPVVEALLDALRRGKEVSVFVELKARFDEESNIAWTHRLTSAGGHVVYGVVGFKTHAKTALVVRREGGGLRRYTHIGSGNYNAATARVYTDLGLLSADPDLGADLTDFFNELTGSSGPPAKDFRRLWVAPHSLAPEIGRCIEREVEHARAGRPARIQAKMNGLADRKVVRALYRASEAGVDVDLVVRAICTLRPGVPGLSSRIRIQSILGRFLEHARIYYFHNAGQDEYFMGSADWRKRNLRKRVEVVTPVDDVAARRRLRSILDAELADPRAWILRPDGCWERRSGPGPTAQAHFLSELD
jgi:polyphosphate kinase